MNRVQRLAYAATHHREDAEDAAQDAVVAALERGLPVGAAKAFTFNKGRELVAKEVHRRSMQERWGEGRKTGKGLASATPEVLAERTRQAHAGKVLATAKRRSATVSFAATHPWTSINDLRQQLAQAGTILHYRTIQRYMESQDVP